MNGGTESCTPLCSGLQKWEDPSCERYATKSLITYLTPKIWVKGFIVYLLLYDLSYKNGRTHLVSNATKEQPVEDDSRICTCVCVCMHAHKEIIKVTYVKFPLPFKKTIQA